jgi:WD40 repeat protein
MTASPFTAQSKTRKGPGRAFVGGVLFLLSAVVAVGWFEYNSPRTIRVVEKDHVVFAVQFSPNGTLLATGDSEGIIKFWNPSDGRLRAAFSAHELGVAKLVFSDDGRTLVSKSAWAKANQRTHEWKAWNVATRQEILLQGEQP